MNFPPNISEIEEPLPGQVQELAPLGLIFPTASAASPGRVHELQNQRAARADVRAPRKEISADEGLQDAGFSAALAPDDGDLRQVDSRRASELSEDILELVDHRNHGVAERVPGSGRGGARCRVLGHGLGFWRLVLGFKRDVLRGFC